MATATDGTEAAWNTQADSRVSSGCEGLDNILSGGFPRGRIYLIEGDPGAGKTTLALQFVRLGAAKGERTLISRFRNRRPT